MFLDFLVCCLICSCLFDWVFVDSVVLVFGLMVVCLFCDLGCLTCIGGDF